MWNITRKMAYFGVNIDMCKICILGANGGIGRHLALLLKLNKYVTDMALYDITNTDGVREDLSHIDTNTRIKAYSGEEEKTLIEALRCSSIVVILAGQAHTPKFATREAMFDANAELMTKFMRATASACRQNMPFIHIVTNPVNALVPLCAEYLKEIKCYDPRKMSGSSSVDTMRARTFLGQHVECDPSKLLVPVVGGHSARSIIPLVSQSKPRFDLKPEEQQKLEDRIVHGAVEVVKAKQAHGAAQLSLGYCVSKFCDSVCRAIYGDKDVVEVGFIPADVNELEYFACNFILDHNGIKECQRLPPMSEYEITLYNNAVKDIKENIVKAKDYIRKQKSKECKKSSKKEIK